MQNYSKGDTTNDNDANKFIRIMLAYTNMMIKSTATKYCKIKRIGLPNENLFHEHSMLQQQSKHQPFVCYDACVL